ncbi:unnamed protein product [Rhodiola kirilowii]
MVAGRKGQSWNFHNYSESERNKSCRSEERMDIRYRHAAPVVGLSQICLKMQDPSGAPSQN